MSPSSRPLLTSAGALLLLLSFSVDAKAHDVSGLVIIFYFIGAVAGLVGAALKYLVLRIVRREHLHAGVLAFLLVWLGELASAYAASLLATALIRPLALGNQFTVSATFVIYSILATIPNAFLLRSQDVPTVWDVLRTRWSLLFAWLLGSFLLPVGWFAFFLLGLMF